MTEEIKDPNAEAAAVGKTGNFPEPGMLMMHDVGGTIDAADDMADDVAKLANQLDSKPYSSASILNSVPAGYTLVFYRFIANRVRLQSSFDWLGKQYTDWTEAVKKDLEWTKPQDWDTEIATLTKLHAKVQQDTDAIGVLIGSVQGHFATVTEDTERRLAAVELTRETWMKILPLLTPGNKQLVTLVDLALPTHTAGKYEHFVDTRNPRTVDDHGTQSTILDGWVKVDGQQLEVAWDRWGNLVSPSIQDNHTLVELCISNAH